MGYMVGLVAHYWSGDTDVCDAFMITDDNAPDYCAVASGLVIAAGANDGDPATVTTRLDVPRDDHERGPKRTHTVKRNPGTWHTMDECPDRFNPDNRDRRPARPGDDGPPIIDGPVRDPRPPRGDRERSP